jgi:hypothetical protein
MDEPILKLCKHHHNGMRFQRIFSPDITIHGIPLSKWTFELVDEKDCIACSTKNKQG